MKSNRTKFFVEVALWLMANVLCIGLATSAAYVAGSTFQGWGPIKIAAFVPLAALLSSTWGSWSSMVWARQRALRVGMYVSAAIPGVLLTGLGIAGFFYLGGAWIVWSGVVLSGIGMLAATATLSRLFNPRTHQVPKLSKFYGIFVHPLITTVASALVIAFYCSFSTSDFAAGWRDFFSIGWVMSTMLALSLVVTVIPAATSVLCRKLAFENGEKMRRD